MACADIGLYKVKFRVRNNIFEEVLSAELFEDMRVNGLQSQVVTELRQENAKSVAIGKFQHPVEILFIEPYKERNVQNMDVDVSRITFICVMIFLSG